MLIQVKSGKHKDAMLATHLRQKSERSINVRCEYNTFRQNVEFL